MPAYAIVHKMKKTPKIPEATITRLSLYCRHLDRLEFDGHRLVSSEKLARLCQVNPAQVRKDLGYFGEFGVRGVGYDVGDLKRELKKILAVNREWNMGIVGIGHLGSSLLQSPIFQARGFNFVAAFDVDIDKIEKPLSCGLIILGVGELKETVKRLNIRIGVITTPPAVAQTIADLFVNSKVNAILNFSPVQVHVPSSCRVENIDLTIKLDILAFKLKHELGINPK